MNKIERIVLYTVFVAALVVLTIFDFRISSSLYNPDSVFGKVFYVGGQAPFLVFATFVSTLAYFFRPKQSKKMSVWFGVLFLAVGVLSAIYSGMELAKGANRLLGSPWHGLAKIGMYLVFAAPCYALGFFPAFFLRKRLSNRKEIFAYAFMILFYALYILVFTNLLKVLAYRPRYRLLASLYEGEGIASHWRPWYAWQTFFNKGAYAADLEVAGVAYKLDDFLSFPSGHTIVSVGVLMVAYFPGLEKRSKWIRPLAYVYGAVVGLSRIFIGDHNATDSLFGFYLGVAAIDIIFSLIRPRFASFLERKKALPEE